jgi:hypothetical protein
MASSAKRVHQVESSGEDLTTPPHSTPEPGSPSAQIANDSAFRQRQNQNQNQSNMTSSGPGNEPPPNQNQIPSHTSEPSMASTPPGQAGEAEKPARKKPGRKPGWTKLRDANGNYLTEPPEGTRKRVRKPKDPNAPPQRRKRKTDSGEASDSAMQGMPRTDIQPRPSSEFNAPPPESQRGNNADISSRLVYRGDFLCSSFYLASPFA